MAVHFNTEDPIALLRKFKAAVDQTQAEGRITTWRPSDDKVYFTHRSQQWEYQAWMKPVSEIGKLTFYIIKSKQNTVSVEAYGFYHGHIIETFLNHFDRDFSEAIATAFPVQGDVVK